jgi:hypothetical protein
MLGRFNQTTTAGQVRGRHIDIPLIVDQLKNREDQFIR